MFLKIKFAQKSHVLGDGLFEYISYVYHNYVE